VAGSSADMVDLPWADLDPRTHAFDREVVEVAIEVVVRSHAAEFGRASVSRRTIQRELDDAILAHAGPWACGWRWAPTEPGGGGPVAGWCCASDSVFAEGDRDARATSTRALGAVVSWREFLVDLDLRFARLRIETAGMAMAEEIARAASRLLVHVIDKTSCEDAWYATFTRTLTWYLQAAGLGDHEAMIDQAVRGRFESWIAPSDDVAVATCAEVARRLGDTLGEGELRDALADWRAVRVAPIALETHPRAPAEGDGHAAFIEGERARDVDRAERMASALLLCRDSAARGLTLSVDQLAEWQSIVLGTSAPVPLRTTDAFAKQGRECYRWTPALADELDGALAEASDPGIDPAVRAARAYLDVCFFHPFPDGNARAARLALDHVLTTARLVLHTAEPVFNLARGADDPEGIWSLAHVIDRCARAR
jgi:hypothetical protein